MQPVDWFRTMARYNRWMNDRLYGACTGIPDGERKRNRGAFFRSIHGTLNHLLLGDRLWMGRFTGVPFPATALDQELYADFDALRRERAVTDEAILAYASSLTAEVLAGTLHYRTLVGDRERSTPLADALLHFFNHQTHHRGQVTTLMMQAGVDPGVTDLMWMDA